MAGLLDVSAVSRYYRNGVTALERVSLSLGTGEFASIVGKSGSGKSTLLHILGGLDRPDSGSVSVRGIPLDFSSRKALVLHRRNTVGFIFQQFFLIPTLTAQENVEYPLIFQGTPRNERRARAARLLDLVGLSARSSHHPSQLSGGEQQRVAIARALVMEPEILLADEPTGNLDTKTGENIQELLLELNRIRKITLVIVTHNERLAERMSRFVGIKDGLLYESR